ncbi:hypothetical protein [Rhizobium sullae]|uniref:hypothetical protein n=1 Tax=Rhizobium sullae TaxID=50338 RepID=UPI0014049543|nr:hypothetical protein [Rhizobium sullae]
MRPSSGFLSSDFRKPTACQKLVRQLFEAGEIRQTRRSMTVAGVALEEQAKSEKRRQPIQLPRFSVQNCTKNHHMRDMPKNVRLIISTLNLLKTISSH